MYYYIFNIFEFVINIYKVSRTYFSVYMCVYNSIIYIVSLNILFNKH